MPFSTSFNNACSFNHCTYFHTIFAYLCQVIYLCFHTANAALNLYANSTYWMKGAINTHEQHTLYNRKYLNNWLINHLVGYPISKTNGLKINDLYVISSAIITVISLRRLLSCMYVTMKKLWTVKRNDYYLINVEGGVFKKHF